VTSFFDGFISLLPVSSASLTASMKRKDLKGDIDRGSMAANAAAMQQHIVGIPRSLSHVGVTVSSSANHVTVHEGDIKQLKHVLDTINTTKTIAKFTLTQQVRSSEKQ
jgi:hypothetical protein